MIASVLITALVFGQADMQSAAGAPPPDLVVKALKIDLNKLAQVDNTQTKLARDIGRELTCLCGTCPREPITDCRCGWAAMNKEALQHLVARGMTREQIVDAYRKSFGDVVMTMPPDEGFARASWILPYSAAGASLLLLLWFGVRQLRKNRAPEPAQDLPPKLEGRQDVHKELAKELDELD